MQNKPGLGSNKPRRFCCGFKSKAFSLYNFLAFLQYCHIAL